MQKVYYEEDWRGKHKIIDNGKIKAKILRKENMSEEYKKILEKRKQESVLQRQEQEEKQKKEKLIHDKIKEIAIEELKKEGKI